jgi:hypothetical protein
MRAYCHALQSLKGMIVKYIQCIRGTVALNMIFTRRFVASNIRHVLFIRKMCTVFDAHERTVLIYSIVLAHALLTNKHSPLFS